MNTRALASAVPSVIGAIGVSTASGFSGGRGDCKSPDPMGAAGCTDPARDAKVRAADQRGCNIERDTICGCRAANRGDDEGGGPGSAAQTSALVAGRPDEERALSC